MMVLLTCMFFFWFWSFALIFSLWSSSLSSQFQFQQPSKKWCFPMRIQSFIPCHQPLCDRGWCHSRTWGKYFFFPFSPIYTNIENTQSGQKEISCSSNTGGVVTSGGGFSFFFKRPAYQTAAVARYFAIAPNIPPTNLYNSTARGYPDVATLGMNLFIHPFTPLSYLAHLLSHRLQLQCCDWWSDSAGERNLC